MYSEYGEKDMRCPGLSLTWSGNRANARLPRACMTKPYDERVRASAYAQNKWQHGDDIPDGGRLFTDWVRRA